MDLSAISEEVDEEYEDLSEEEEEAEDEEEEEETETESSRNRLTKKLQLIGNEARLKGLQELRELYSRVSGRLSKAKEGEDSRLKRAEEKVVSFLEDDEDVKEKKELRVFKKMEKFTERPSFDSSISMVEKFMDDKLHFDTTQSEMDASSVGLLTEQSEVESSLDEEEEEEVKILEKVVPPKGNLGGRKKDSFPKEKQSNLPNFPIGVGKNELDTIKQLREKVEETECNLRMAKQAFEKYKTDELAKLDKKREQLVGESALLEKYRNQSDQLRTMNLEYLSKISALEDKLKVSNLEWSKKSTAWNLAKTKSKKQIDELEKRCKILEDKLAKYISKPQSTTVRNLAPKMPRRIQFQELENLPVPVLQDLSDNKDRAPGYFSSISAQNSTSTQKPLRSSLKQRSIPNHKGLASTSGENPKVNNSELIGSNELGDVKENHNPCDRDGEKDPSKGIQRMDYQAFTGSDDVVETVFPNGTRKYISKSKQFRRTIYNNGDIKERRADGSIHYFFATFGLRHYIYPSGLEMTTYKNGQIQRKNADGTQEILYPNGCVKVSRSDGKEEFIFPDNTVYQMGENGCTIILLPNGQKEIHSESWKKRIFPDGTTKTVFADGSTETTYSNGRTRVKNPAGQLILDTTNESANESC